jgi:hypothetical protein
MQERKREPRFPKHFGGARFSNPNSPKSRSFLDLLRWKLTSRPEPGAPFVSDVEPSKAPPCVEAGDRITSTGAFERRWFMSPVRLVPEQAVRGGEIATAQISIAIHHGTFRPRNKGIDTPKRRLSAYAPGHSSRVLDNSQSATRES